MKRVGDKFEKGECRPCEKPGYLGFKYIGKGKAGSLLTTHCTKILLHYYISFLGQQTTVVRQPLVDL